MWIGCHHWQHRYRSKQGAYGQALAGPVDHYFKQAPNVPDAITGGRETIALRYPKHALLTSVLMELNEPPVHQCQHEHSHGDHPSTFKCRSIYPWGYPW